MTGDTQGWDRTRMGTLGADTVTWDIGGDTQGWHKVTGDTPGGTLRWQRVAQGDMGHGRGHPGVAQDMHGDTGR